MSLFFDYSIIILLATTTLINCQSFAPTITGPSNLNVAAATCLQNYCLIENNLNQTLSGIAACPESSSFEQCVLFDDSVVYDPTCSTITLPENYCDPNILQFIAGYASGAIEIVGPGVLIGAKNMESASVSCLQNYCQSISPPQELSYITACPVPGGGNECIFTPLNDGNLFNPLMNPTCFSIQLTDLELQSDFCKPNSQQFLQGLATGTIVFHYEVDKSEHLVEYADGPTNLITVAQQCLQSYCQSSDSASAESQSVTSVVACNQDGYVQCQFLKNGAGFNVDQCFGITLNVTNYCEPSILSEILAIASGANAGSQTTEVTTEVTTQQFPTVGQVFACLLDYCANNAQPENWIGMTVCSNGTCAYSFSLSQSNSGPPLEFGCEFTYSYNCETAQLQRLINNWADTQYRYM